MIEERKYDDCSSNNINPIEQIRIDIINVFNKNYNQDLAMCVLSAYDHVIKNEQFDELDLIKDDVNDQQHTIILENICKNIKILINDPIYDASKIKQLLKQSVHGNNCDFHIKALSFAVMQPHITKAAKLLIAECPFIYRPQNNSRMIIVRLYTFENIDFDILYSSLGRR